jgi:hypothetical protein
MKRLLTTLLLATLCATGYGQTIKSLGYNTNGIVIGPTNALTFTNSITKQGEAEFGGGQGVLFFYDFEGNKDIFFFDGGENDEARARQNLGLSATWLTNTNADTFRGDIGIPLTALTNTNNADTMRALAGSTNTNEPFSGSIIFTDDVNDQRTIAISNGIILSVSDPF